jgi:hypothetical protein
MLSYRFIFSVPSVFSVVNNFLVSCMASMIMRTCISLAKNQRIPDA